MSKWSALSALGEMAKGGGQYFGSLHAESVRNQRLAEARAEKVADRDDNRAYQTTQVEEARGYQDTVRADERAYLTEQRAAAREQALGDRDEQRAYTKANTPVAASKLVEGGDGYYYEQTANGLVKTETRHNGDVTEGTGGSGKDMTEGQRTLAMRSQLGATYLDAMNEVIGGGFDPTTPGAYVEKLANKFDLTRGMTSKESQAFSVAAEGMTAAILRTDTGAAAPEPEQVRYVARLIPNIGESKELVAWKMGVLEKTFDAMAAASKGGATDEDIRAAALSAATVFEKDNPMPKEQVDAPSVRTHNRTPEPENEIDDILSQY